ncbi:MAG TPA: hypothetical protein VL463_21125 [Kofleriaceae bacterium]|jgi:hypothetical protein|nr:hypothetical protein [Kofleriaceae bacterium]
MQPPARDDASAPEVAKAPPIEATPVATIALDPPAAHDDDDDGTVLTDADLTDSARPTQPYLAVLGGEGTD